MRQRRGRPSQRANPTAPTPISSWPLPVAFIANLILSSFSARLSAPVYRRRKRSFGPSPPIRCGPECQLLPLCHQLPPLQSKVPLLRRCNDVECRQFGFAAGFHSTVQCSLDSSLACDVSLRANA